MGIFSGDKEIAIKKFKEHNGKEDADKFLDDVLRTRLTDEEARGEIIKLLGGYGIPARACPKYKELKY